jgi:hypothetical protein
MDLNYLYQRHQVSLFMADNAASQQARRDDRLYYQLTHDYLVPSLREWLTRKQKETRRGRAELRLAERAAAGSDPCEPAPLARHRLPLRQHPHAGA